MEEHLSVTPVLEEFRRADAAAVLGWVKTPEEAEQWASLSYPQLRPSIFDEWHAAEGVLPFIGRSEGELCAYGEIWEDPEEDEAELARVIVAPARRGSGLGRAFVSLLAAEAARRGWRDIWVRVVPENAPAIACYRRAGFVRASTDDERAFNREQEREYVWMRLADPGA